MLFLMLTFVATGLLLVAISIPMMLRRVKPNGFYGLRVPATFADEWVWYEANAQSGRDMIIAGAAIVFVALLLYALPGISRDRYAGINAGFSFVAVMVSAFIGWRRANQLLAERRG